MSRCATLAVRPPCRESSGSSGWRLSPCRGLGFQQKDGGTQKRKTLRSFGTTIFVRFFGKKDGDNQKRNILRDFGYHNLVNHSFGGNGGHDFCSKTQYSVRVHLFDRKMVVTKTQHFSLPPSFRPYRDFRRQAPGRPRRTAAI